MHNHSRLRGFIGLGSSFVLAMAGIALTAAPSPADSDPRDPADPRTPTTVTADALPTTQVDGVVWSQVIVGDTVYAAGSFANARPPGVQDNVNETPRQNLLAYDINTGALKTSFAPTINGQILSITRSPDGSRIYIGGQFTTVNGQSRSRIAAFDTATGQLNTAFKPAAGSTVRAVTATDSAVYFGGDFTRVSNISRPYLAGASASNGAVLPWNPTPNSSVLAVAMTPDNSAVAAGGRFSTMNGASAYGMTAVDVNTAQPRNWAVTSVIRNAGTKGAILSMTADEDSLYATGYDLGAGSNFEGTVRINPTTGAIIWMEDCHGDTYSAFSGGGSVYTASHKHHCNNVGGFPEISPRRWKHSVAFSKATTGTLLTNNQGGYDNFAGRPSPSQLNWFPTTGIGVYTGQSQASWHVTGNSKYIVYGGEFPTVNGKIQQGLVRYAKKADATNKVGPALGNGMVPTVTSPGTGAAQVTWTSAYDFDNTTLTYKVYRNNVLVHTVQGDSTFWQLPTVRFTDSKLPAGSSQSYRVTASDSSGNTVNGPSASVTIAGGASTLFDGYSASVLNSGPRQYWRMGEASGSTASDLSGNSLHATFQGNRTQNTSGVVSGSPNGAVTLAGSNGSVASNSTTSNPTNFSEELWFKTASTRGGRLIGFGSSKSSTSGSFDRNVWMINSGKLRFSVAPGGVRTTIETPASYNNNAWHHVVATQSAAGMRLYVDGAQVASNSTVKTAQNYTGYWRVGYDNTPGGGTDNFFAGAVDEAAIYTRALAADEVSTHYNKAIGVTPNVAPTSSFTWSADDLVASFDGTGSGDSDGTVNSYAWDFGDGENGTGATPDHTYDEAGSYTVTLTVTDDDGATASTSHEVDVTAAPPPDAPVAKDVFDRTQPSGFGTADTGGAWSVLGGAANFSVGSSAGHMRVPAGASLRGFLNGVSITNVDTTATVSLDKAPAGGGASFGVIGRGTANDAYRGQVGISASGAATLNVTKIVGGAATSVRSVSMPGLGFAANTDIRLRMQVTGSSPTTVRLKAWKASDPEPATWLINETDSTAGLQGASGVGVWANVSAAATNAPIVASWGDIESKPVVAP